MKRREFIRKSAAGGILLGASSFPFEAFAKGDAKKITILHTNDQHSRIEPFPMDGGKFQGLGGFAQRAMLINEIRKREKNVLLFDSGDIWQGTPYFNKFLGEVEFKLMSEMKYDAATLGNHDFDAGMDGFVKQLPHTNFSFVNCNYDFSDSPLNGKILPHKIFKIDEISVGVFGLGIELEGLVPRDLFGNVRYLDPIAHANKTANLLKNDLNCDLVICLSHLGYKYDDKKVSDVVLVQTTKNIDLILGGHTHTFFDNPEELRNTDGARVLVNQVGWAGIYLGRIDFYFEKKKNGILIPNVPKLVTQPRT